MKGTPINPGQKPQTTTEPSTTQQPPQRPTGLPTTQQPQQLTTGQPPLQQPQQQGNSNFYAVRSHMQTLQQQGKLPIQMKPQGQGTGVTPPLRPQVPFTPKTGGPTSPLQQQPIIQQTGGPTSPLQQQPTIQQTGGPTSPRLQATPKSPQTGGPTSNLPPLKGVPIKPYFQPRPPMRQRAPSMQVQMLRELQQRLDFQVTGPLKPQSNVDKSEDSEELDIPIVKQDEDESVQRRKEARETVKFLDQGFHAKTADTAVFLIAEGGERFDPAKVDAKFPKRTKEFDGVLTAMANMVNKASKKNQRDGQPEASENEIYDAVEAVTLAATKHKEWLASKHPKDMEKQKEPFLSEHKECERILKSALERSQTLNTVRRARVTALQEICKEPTPDSADLLAALMKSNAKEMKFFAEKGMQELVDKLQSEETEVDVEVLKAIASSPNPAHVQFVEHRCVGTLKQADKAKDPLAVLGPYASFPLESVSKVACKLVEGQIDQAVAQGDMTSAARGANLLPGAEQNTWAEQFVTARDEETVFAMVRALTDTELAFSRSNPAVFLRGNTSASKMITDFAKKAGKPAAVSASKRVLELAKSVPVRPKPPDKPLDTPPKQPAQVGNKTENVRLQSKYEEDKKKYDAAVLQYPKDLLKYQKDNAAYVESFGAVTEAYLEDTTSAETFDSISPALAKMLADINDKAAILFPSNTGDTDQDKKNAREVAILVGGVLNLRLFNPGTTEQAITPINELNWELDACKKIIANKDGKSSAEDIAGAKKREQIAKDRLEKEGPGLRTAQSNALLCTKIQQNVSNGVLAGQKEQWMKDFNPIMEEHLDSTRGFVDALVQKGKGKVSTEVWGPELTRVRKQLTELKTTVSPLQLQGMNLDQVAAGLDGKDLDSLLRAVNQAKDTGALKIARANALAVVQEYMQGVLKSPELTVLENLKTGGSEKIRPRLVRSLNILASSLQPT
jgi:hypothetical protein